MEKTAPVSSEVQHPLLNHPLASELMASVADWITKESLGQDASDELTRMLSIAARMRAWN
jgi:hypothetical protein